MRQLLVCVLLAAACYQARDVTPITMVNVSPLPYRLEYELACSEDDIQLLYGWENEVTLGNPCTVPHDPPYVCQIFMDLPPGETCTMLIEVFDEAGEGCMQVEELAIEEEGDTEIDIVLDDCEPLLEPYDGT